MSAKIKGRIRAEKTETSRSPFAGPSKGNLAQGLASGLVCTLAAALFIFVLPAQGKQSRLLMFADQILNEVSHLRRLAIQEPVQKGVKSRSEIREALQRKIAREFDAQQLEAERRALVKLGLLPPDYDYVNEVVNLLQEQIAGYYDPDAKTFYIADWLPSEEQKITMAHELTHALQDQHFGLKRMIEEPKGNDDRLQARRALVEGEAVAVMLDYILRPMRRDFLSLPDLRRVYGSMIEQNKDRQKTLLEAPEILRETLLFPYIHGSRFMQVYRRWHSWDDVKKLYQDPPASTEQILHPNKYAGIRDDPTEVAAAATGEFESEWRSVYSNVLGEFSTYLLLKRFVDEPQAARASRGWDGDSIQLFEAPDGRLGLILRSVWDSDKDAEQFAAAYAEATLAKHPDLQPAAPRPAGAARVQWENPSGRVRIELDGAWVTVYEIDLAPSQTG